MRAFNKGMFNKYLDMLRHTWDFCQYVGWDCFPLEPEKSALFVTFLDNGKRNADTIRSYHSSVRTVARLMGIKVPKKESSEVLLVLKGMKKSNPRPRKLAFPMTPAILKLIGYNINHDDPFQATLWSLFSISFFLMLRKSNVCKTYGTDDNYLRCSHIKIKGNYILVKIFWTKTKTLQLGEKVLEMPLLSILGSSLCPFRAMTNMFRLCPKSKKSPLFSFPDGKPITYPVYMRFLKQKISDISLESANYSTHSFQRGAVSWAIKCGIPESMIQVMGN